VPQYIQEAQFLYRIRADSMHQSLLQNQARASTPLPPPPAPHAPATQLGD